MAAEAAGGAGGVSALSVTVPDVCTACHLEFQPTDCGIAVQNLHVHGHCFRCTVCGVRLPIDAFLWAGDALYCGEHYLELFNRRCAVCNDTTLDALLSFKGKLYHPKCARCKLCRRRVTLGMPLDRHSNELQCRECNLPPVGCLYASQTLTVEVAEALLQAAGSPGFYFMYMPTHTSIPEHRYTLSFWATSTHLRHFPVIHQQNAWFLSHRPDDAFADLDQLLWHFTENVISDGFTLNFPLEFPDQPLPSPGVLSPEPMPAPFQPPPPPAAAAAAAPPPQPDATSAAPAGAHLAVHAPAATTAEAGDMVRSPSRRKAKPKTDAAGDGSSPGVKKVKKSTRQRSQSVGAEAALGTAASETSVEASPPAHRKLARTTSVGGTRMAKHRETLHAINGKQKALSAEDVNEDTTTGSKKKSPSNDDVNGSTASRKKTGSVEDVNGSKSKKVVRKVKKAANTADVDVEPHAPSATESAPAPTPAAAPAAQIESEPPALQAVPAAPAPTTEPSSTSTVLRRVSDTETSRSLHDTRITHLHGRPRMLSVGSRDAPTVLSIPVQSGPRAGEYKRSENSSSMEFHTKPLEYMRKSLSAAEVRAGFSPRGSFDSSSQLLQRRAGARKLMVQPPLRSITPNGEMSPRVITAANSTQGTPRTESSLSTRLNNLPPSLLTILIPRQDSADSLVSDAMPTPTLEKVIRQTYEVTPLADGEQSSVNPLALNEMARNERKLARASSESAKSPTSATRPHAILNAQRRLAPLVPFGSATLGSGSSSNSLGSSHTSASQSATMSRAGSGASTEFLPLGGNSSQNVVMPTLVEAISPISPPEPDQPLRRVSSSSIRTPSSPRSSITAAFLAARSVSQGAMDREAIAEARTRDPRTLKSNGVVVERRSLVLDEPDQAVGDPRPKREKKWTYRISQWFAPSSSSGGSSSSSGAGSSSKRPNQN